MVLTEITNLSARNQPVCPADNSILKFEEGHGEPNNDSPISGKMKNINAWRCLQCFKLYELTE